MPALIAPAISDTCAAVKRSIVAWQAAALAQIQDALSVDFEQPQIDQMEAAATAAAEVLQSQLEAELEQRIGSQAFVDHIDPENDARILEVAESIVATTAAVAGGAAVFAAGAVLGALRNRIGLATDGEAVGSDGVAQGPASERLINVAFNAHAQDAAGDAQTAGARVRLTNIPEALKDALESAVQIVRRWTWHREALGPVASGNEFPGHRSLDGTVYNEAQLETLGQLPQRPHRNCKCALELTRLSRILPPSDMATSATN